MNYFQFTKLVNGLINDELVLPIHPSAFRSQITKNHSEFASNHQQDAMEFLLYLLKELDRYEHRTGTQTTEQLFTFEIEDRLEVDNHVKYSKRSETVFPLSVDQTTGSFADCLSRSIAKIPIEGFRSPLTGEITGNAFKSFTIATMPPYLMMSVNRYYVNEKYQAEKLDCEVKMPERLDLEPFRARGIQAGESLLPAEIRPEANPEILSQLVAMGFANDLATTACLATNNKDAETALQWLLAGNTGSPETVSDESVMMLTAMVMMDDI